MKIYFWILILAFGSSRAQTPDFVKNELDSYVKKGLKQWDLPGLAIVIVKDGKVVISKGFGVKDIETKSPVDENTHFFIASNTKLFTGTALAWLAYQKKLNLNDPISKYYPEYRLYDSLSTLQVSIRDMLSHRIGTKTFQGDFTFWNTSLTREEIMGKMKLLKPTGVFRQDYGYCNSCFLTAGQIIPKVTNDSWEQFVEKNIVAPLGITQTFVASNGVRNKTNNMAVPYTTSFTGKLQRVPDDNWDNLGPAASIVSNVKDLTKWLLMQLDSGRLAGKQILPWPVIQTTRDVQIVTHSRKSGYLPMHFTGYGLGLFAGDYNGKQLFWHTGGAAGMVSNVCFVPEENLGIAILTNNDNQSFFEALRYMVLDAYLGVPKTDRSEFFYRPFADGEKKQAQEIANWEKIAGKANPPLPLEAFTGKFSNPIYGNITITGLPKNQLEIRFEHHPELIATLQYLSEKEWLIRFNNIEYGIYKVPFEQNGSRITGFELKVNDFIEYDTYLFTKQSN